MTGRETRERVRDRTIQSKRNWGNQVLPVATTALYHFCISLSSIPSLWCSLWFPLSLLSSISSQLSLTVYLAHIAPSSIQPVSPGNGTNLTPTPVCIWACRTCAAAVPWQKACGSNSHDGHRVDFTVRMSQVQSPWNRVHPLLQAEESMQSMFSFKPDFWFKSFSLVWRCWWWLVSVWGAFHCNTLCWVCTFEIVLHNCVHFLYLLMALYVSV